MRKELIEWSKWIIAINFGAATGCIIAFDKKSPTLFDGWPFLLAILFFSLNVLVSITFTFYLTMQTLPAKYHRFLGNLQIWLFILGLTALSIWIVKKVDKSSTEVENIKVVTKEKTVEIKLQDKPVEVTIKLSSP